MLQLMTSRPRARRQLIVGMISGCAILACNDHTPEPPDYDKPTMPTVFGKVPVGTPIWTLDLTTKQWSPRATPAPTPVISPKYLSWVAGAPAIMNAPSLLSGASAGPGVGEVMVALLTGGARPGVELATRIALYVTASDASEVQMVTARTEHAIALLSGQRVLVTGGYTAASVAQASAEIFSASTQTFAATGAMHFARGDHAMATLGDGRVLVTGGLVPNGLGAETIDAATTEIFNPASGTFTDGPTMSVARFNHSAVTLNDGRVLIIGGNGRRSAEIYEPGTNTFTTLPDMAVNHGNGHQAVKLATGKVLVLGGDAATIAPSAVAELFDPTTNRWTTVGSMGAARMLHSAVLAPDGTVIICGGRGADGSDLSSCEIYDPTGNTFSPIAPMPFAASEHAAVIVGGSP